MSVPSGPRILTPVSIKISDAEPEATNGFPTIYDPFTPEELWINFLVYLGLFIFCISVFTFCRRNNFCFLRVYYPNYPHNDRHLTAYELMQRRSAIKPLPQKHFFSWLCYLMDSQRDIDVLLNTGLDAYITLRLAKVGIFIFGVWMPIGMLIIAPIYGANKDHGALLDRISLSNLTKDNGDIFRFVFCCMLVFVALVLFCMRQEYEHFIKVRLEMIKMKHLVPETFTVVVERIPKNLLSRKVLTQYFETIVGQEGKVDRVELVPSNALVGDLDRLMKKRALVLDKIQLANRSNNKIQNNQKQKRQKLLTFANRMPKDVLSELRTVNIPPSIAAAIETHSKIRAKYGLFKKDAGLKLGVNSSPTNTNGFANRANHDANGSNHLTPETSLAEFKHEDEERLIQIANKTLAGFIDSKSRFFALLNSLSCNCFRKWFVANKGASEVDAEDFYLDQLELIQELIKKLRDRYRFRLEAREVILNDNSEIFGNPNYIPPDNNPTTARSRAETSLSATRQTAANSVFGPSEEIVLQRINSELGPRPNFHSHRFPNPPSTISSEQGNLNLLQNFDNENSRSQFNPVPQTLSRDSFSTHDEEHRTRVTRAASILRLNSNSVQDVLNAGSARNSSTYGDIRNLKPISGDSNKNNGGELKRERTFSVRQRAVAKSKGLLEAFRTRELAEIERKKKIKRSKSSSRSDDSNHISKKDNNNTKDNNPAEKMDKVKEQKDIKVKMSEKDDFLSVAFVTFTTQYTANLVTRIPVNELTDGMRTTIAKPVSSMLLNNLGYSQIYKTLMSIVLTILGIMLLLSFGSLVGLIAVVTNLKNLRRKIKGLNEFLERFSGLVAVFEELGPLIVVIAFLLVPTVLLTIIPLRKPISMAEKHLIFFRSYYFFQVIQLFLFYLISGSLVNVIGAGLLNPWEWVSILAITIPANSYFYMHFVLIKALFVVPADLARILDLVLGVGLRFLLTCGTTVPREAERDRHKTKLLDIVPSVQNPFALLARANACALLVQTIGITYSISNPVFSVACFFYCVIYLIVYRNQLLFVYAQRIKAWDSMGHLFPALIECYKYALLLMVTMMMGLFALFQQVSLAVFSGFLLLFIILITNYFYTVYSEDLFGLPLSLARLYELDDQLDNIKFKRSVLPKRADFVSNRFIVPDDDYAEEVLRSRKFVDNSEEKVVLG